MGFKLRATGSDRASPSPHNGHSEDCGLVDAGIREISENRRLARRGEGRGEVVSRQLSQGDTGDVGDKEGAEEVLIAVPAGGSGGGLETQWLPEFLLS